MDTRSFKTISANRETADKRWVVVDASGQPLGRLASKVAKLIRGKHKTNFTPHVDCGDYVIVLNAEKVSLSGNKWQDKNYIRHTGYPGGQRSNSAKEILNKKPYAIIENAVRGMLPKNRLGRKLFNNLHVVVGSEHKFQAQKPEALDINNIK